MLSLYGSYVFQMGGSCFTFVTFFFQFSRLGSELIPQRQLKEEAEAMMQHLMSLVQNTAVSIEVICEV